MLDGEYWGNFSIYSIGCLHGIGHDSGYGMIILLFGLWCCASESAWQRLRAMKVQNKIELALLIYLNVFNIQIRLYKNIDNAWFIAS